MKATGIVRRVDCFGRIVIPKEVRRMLDIKEGDAIEMLTDDGGLIVLEKYSSLGECSDFETEEKESR